ncbi:checkpoint serine/threonine-protein kinase BUB1, partial [Atractiella rhizophila]
LQHIHRRPQDRLRTSIIRPQSFYEYSDEGYLLLDYCEHGSLLDVVNRASEYNLGPSNGGLEEVLAIFFTIELLRVIEGLHSAGFVHGDFKIDNVMLRLDEIPGGSKAWESVYSPSGSGGWAHLGVKVIDFGRSIDMSLFPPSQTFNSDLQTDKYDCIELREPRPWSYQPDYYGLAGIAYCLLFGKYMETNATLRRYHQVDLWTRFFDILLNPTTARDDGSLPITDELGEIRESMEAWL